MLIVVEGDDDKIVYSYWISRVIPEIAYEFFVCGGKRGVRQLRNTLHEDVRKADTDVVFLVDRDFDDLQRFISTEKVFMLDRYSVENYLVDTFVVELCVKIAFPGNGDPDNRAVICRLFEKDYNDFLSVAFGVNRRLFVARRLDIDVDGEIPTTLTKLANVELGNVIASEHRPEQALPYPLEPAPEHVEPLEQEFARLDPAKRHRGKFAYRFFRTWLERLSDEYRNSKIGLFAVSEQGPGKIKPDEMSLGSLASRSPMPEGLGDFLEKWRPPSVKDC